MGLSETLIIPANAGQTTSVAPEQPKEGSLNGVPVINLKSYIEQLRIEAKAKIPSKLTKVISMAAAISELAIGATLLVISKLAIIPTVGGSIAGILGGYLLLMDGVNRCQNTINKWKRRDETVTILNNDSFIDWAQKNHLLITLNNVQKHFKTYQGYLAFKSLI